MLPRRKLLEYWWVAPVAAVAGFFGWLGVRSFNILVGKPAPVKNPTFKPVAKVAVARVAQFPELWDAVEFKLGSTPAVLVRVQAAQEGGLSIQGKHFIALSRDCTHLRCVTEYIKNPEITAMAYKYRPEFKHPVLGCACHFSAFDPELAGKSVSGPALKPLPRIQLEHRGNQIFAVGIETT
ncbi:MAG: Rieske 2Fe-2S domain-containing protein [Deinococcales bacterium]